MLCQPTDSVGNEQQFSNMNKINTNLRSQLQPPHLNACMRIHAGAFEVESFPFQAAFDHYWHTAKERRGI